MANPSSIHDTVRVVKVIVDTVRVSSRDSLDLLTKVDSFYNNAWTKLIVAFSVIGVLFPVLVQWYQNHQLKLEKADFDKKIEEDQKKTEAAIKVFFEKNIEAAKAELKQEISKEKEYLSNNAEGAAFHLQAIMYKESDPDISFYSALEAILKYLKGGSANRVAACISIAKKAIQTTTKSKIGEVFTKKSNEDFKGILNAALILSKNDEVIKKELEELNNKYDALT